MFEIIGLAGSIAASQPAQGSTVRATVRGSGYTLLKDLLVRHNSLGICVEKMFAMLAVMNM